MSTDQELKRVRQIFQNKKVNPDFQYFADKGVDYFVNWFMTLERKCCYCGIEEYKLRELFVSKRLSTKRPRGQSLELERFDSKQNQYTESNCALACYFCNNHKSDIITRSEHQDYFSESISKYINDLYQEQVKITDSQTNFLYLSTLLKSKYPIFSERFVSILNKENINTDFLPETKDVWAVDYMPVQTKQNKFIQFKYNPDYLRDYKTHKEKITDTTAVCERIGIETTKTEIIADGGNLIKSKSKVIMTSKVFKENPNYKFKELIKEIEKLLELRLIIIPLEPKDWIGHADGMVRFVDNYTVLINDYSKETDLYYTEFKMSLRNAGLETIEIPYNPYKNSSDNDATGLYINYLQMDGAVFVPTFDLPEDELALRQFERIFPGQRIIPVKSNEVSKDGGVLNCVTWNIRR